MPSIIHKLPEEENIIGLPYNKAILKIALPAILSFVCQIFFEFIDAYWLGRLESSEVFAAVGAASFITWSLYALMNIITAGVNSYVAQYRGSLNKKRYQDIAFQGIVLSIISGLIITILMLTAENHIFVYMGLKGNLLKSTKDFFLIMNLGFVVFFVYNTTGIIFNAHGDTKITLWTTIIPLIINILIDPLLILGYNFIPKMGIKGAAIATIISSAVGITLRLYYLLKKEFINSHPSLSCMSFKDSMNIIKVGIPVAAGNFIFCMVFPVLTKFITMLDNTEALSALNIAHRVEGIAYFVCVGFSVSASTMVGQYTGIKDLKRAKEAGWYNIFYISIFLFIISLIFIFYPDPLITVMTGDEKVLEEGKNYLRIIGYFEIFLGLEIVFQGIFTGTGKTIYPSLIYIPLTLARIPVAHFMAFKWHMGVEGIWWAISISTFFKGFLVTLLFLSGIWAGDVKKINILRKLKL